MIYTSGYTSKQSNTEIIYSPSSRVIALTDSENLELKRYATLNFAGGTEIYLTEFMSIRLGSFTNFANSKPLAIIMTAVELNKTPRPVTEKKAAHPAIIIADRPNKSLLVNLRFIPKFTIFETKNLHFQD
jgi:hypothetical protein